jgi:FkbM family methyltransferase
MPSGKNFAKKLFSKLGYKISKLTGIEIIDNDNAFGGMKSLMNEADQRGIFFDVGANTGQTIQLLEKYFPAGNIYAFEPGKSAFNELKRKFTGNRSLHLENIALGSNEEVKEFFENTFSTMSSFLHLGKEGWGEVIEKTKIKLTSIDQFCKKENISHINILKSDTQGFELEVLNGAKEMLSNKAIQFVYLEINFIELYKELPTFSDIYNFLNGYGYKLLRFYDFNYYENAVGWSDALFYHPDFGKQ